MKRVAIPFIFGLWPAVAGAAEITSAYTRFDLAKCQVIEKGDEYVFTGVWRCPGLGGVDIFQASSDDRSYAAFGRDGTAHCAFRKTFGPLNTALSPVEWRLRDGKPFAAIERWAVFKDDAVNSYTWLVINALRPADSCPVHYVAGSFPAANQQARDMADRLAEGFDCETGVPTYDSTIGPPPIELLSCAAVKQQGQ
ncbi:MAG: hypothetical protein ACRCTG_10415 [Aestuariivirga sp.]